MAKFNKSSIVELISGSFPMSIGRVFTKKDMQKINKATQLTRYDIGEDINETYYQCYYEDKNETNIFVKILPESILKLTTIEDSDNLGFKKKR